MPGIRDQRHRTGNPAIHRLDRHECGVEHDTDQEGIAEELAASVPASRMPVYIENLLGLYLDERRSDEAFVTYARRQDKAELRERLATRSDAAAAAQNATEERAATDAETPEGAKTALEPTVESDAEVTPNPQDAEAKREDKDDQTNAA